MQTNWFQNLYISVGIDVGADFSWMSIALPNQTFHGKPFKITHSDLDSLKLAVSKIKEAEELYSLEIRIFLESTGIYHYPLFCYLRDKGFNVFLINPIITKNSTNINIRKVHNDPADSKKAALVGLKSDLKVSLIPSDTVLDLRNICREYYDLMDSRSAYVNKLQGELRMFFPQYLGVFSKVTINSSLTLLDIFGSPQAFLDAPKEEIIQSIRQYDQQISAVISDMHELVDRNEGTKLVEQIRLIESFRGAGFLSAVSLMAEIGDFSAFRSPKQLFAYLGLDPSVKKSGKWEGTKNSMSKRGSAIARRVIHTLALQSIGKNRDGSAKNPVLRDYYEQKCQSKPKMVSLGAVMHKVCNIVFAILRDEKPYRIITPEEHCQDYSKAKCGTAA